jgi:hypothetical protein
MIDFKGSHFERDVILLAIRWYQSPLVSVAAGISQGIDVRSETA